MHAGARRVRVAAGGQRVAEPCVCVCACVRARSLSRINLHSAKFSEEPYLLLQRLNLNSYAQSSVGEA